MHMSKLTACLSVVGTLLCLSPEIRAEDLRIGGTGAALGTMQFMATAFERVHPEHHVSVLPSMGSKGGIKAVVAGAIDLAVSSRALASDEIAAGQTISWPELADAYAGKLTQWPDGTRIRLIMRPSGDADTERIKAVSPAMREAVTTAEQRKGMTFAITDQDAADQLEKVPGALGPLTLAQILSEKRSLKALRLNGVAPDAATLADGSYPMHKEMLFVTGGKTGTAAQSFMAFVRSPAGRAVLVQTGHWIP